MYNNKPIIGITTGIDRGCIVNRSSDYFYLKRQYTQKIQKAGAIPILLTPEMSCQEIHQLCDGIIFPGGNDVPTTLYGETSKYNEIIPEHPDRVSWEQEILQYFQKKPKPILGVCYGMQFINVYFGGSLYQDIDREIGGHIEHGNQENPAFHQVELIGDSCLHHWLQETFEVCSIHHQAIKEIAPEFRSIARSSDGIIEAISYANFLGVAWHPENDSTGEPLFQCFVGYCNEVRQGNRETFFP